MFFAVILFILIALLGAPLFTVLAASGLLISYQTDISPDILVIEMHRLAASPNMMAIPLFTLAGVVMSSGGAPKRLVDLFRATFGWMPGGLAIVSIGACAFFTTFSARRRVSSESCSADRVWGPTGSNLIAVKPCST